jgi:TPP-dependent pyruvate/acetoin dehydrogenase alpha subunit
MDKLLEIHKKACINREFEKEVFRQVQNKTVTIPVYLSAGQEYISATLATLFEEIEKQIFIQHRGHSTYLSFGGNMDELVL